MNTWIYNCMYLYEWVICHNSMNIRLLKFAFKRCRFQFLFISSQKGNKIIKTQAIKDWKEDEKKTLLSTENDNITG